MKILTEYRIANICKKAIFTNLSYKFGMYSTYTESIKKLTIKDIERKYKRNEPITMITSYDYTSMQLIEKSNAIDMVLVGDSLGMVMLGKPDSNSVTIEEMIHHCRAVVAGSKKCFVIGDLPMGTYEISDEAAVKNAIRLIKEGNVQAVKLEGGKRVSSRINAIIKAGIPVLGHIGLTPQSHNALGGFLVQGKTSKEIKSLIEDAKEIENSGCFGIVIESVPQKVGELITSSISIPTIGIGAGNGTNGQLLVWHDMFSLYQNFKPKFAKVFKNIDAEIIEGLQKFNEEVKNNIFPCSKYSYSISTNEWNKFIEETQKNKINPNGSRKDLDGTFPRIPSSSFNVKIEPSQSEVEGRKKICIIGGGSMASLYGYFLASEIQNSNLELWMITGWDEHISTINKHGLKLEGIDGQLRITRNIRATSEPNECISNGKSTFDLVLILVKSNQTNDAVISAKKLYRNNAEDCSVLTLQNGIGNRDILVDEFGENNVIQGITNHGAMMIDPGLVKHTGIGKTFIAIKNGDSSTEYNRKVDRICEIFNKVQLNTEKINGIEKLIWKKLVVSSGMNPITAITGMTNGELLKNEDAFKFALKTCEETYQVAKASNIDLCWDDLIVNIKNVLKYTGINRSSMLQDVLRGVETEIDSINGAIIRQGQKLGIPTPYNITLFQAIKNYYSTETVQTLMNAFKKDLI